MLISLVYFIICKQIIRNESQFRKQISFLPQMVSGLVHRRNGPVMTKATMRLVYNVVEIYAPGHACYNEVDLYWQVWKAGCSLGLQFVSLEYTIYSPNTDENYFRNSSTTEQFSEI